MPTAILKVKIGGFFFALPWLGMNHAFLCLLPFSTATAVWNLPPEFCVSNLKDPCPGRLKQSEFVGKRGKIRNFFFTAGLRCVQVGKEERYCVDAQDGTK